MKFSLVIPCYNEADSLEILISRCKRLIQKIDCEVILVDNGSTDKTSKILDKTLANCKNIYSVKVKKNIGYGHGILTGLKITKGDIIGWTHADLQTDPIDCLNGIKLLENSNSKIFLKGKRYGRPFFDVFFTIGMTIFETILLGKFMNDINAQPTLFSRELFETW